MNDRLITERVTTLLSHYWTADEPAALRALQIGDWLEDLGEFAAQFVTAAVREWRQGPTGNRRPTPADIRLLTIAELRKHAKPAEAPRQVTDMHREPMPEVHVVREGWRKIPYSLLTEAERELFDRSISPAARNAMTALGIGKPIP